jgi:hypothetical protein
MTRPMSANAQLVACVGLRGRRQELWIMVEHWFRELARELPLALETSTRAQWHEVVWQELQRRDGRLQVRCLCEEDFVLDAVWRIVSNDEDDTHAEDTP